MLAKDTSINNKTLTSLVIPGITVTVVQIRLIKLRLCEHTLSARRFGVFLPNRADVMRLRCLKSSRKISSTLNKTIQLPDVSYLCQTSHQHLVFLSAQHAGRRHVSSAGVCQPKEWRSEGERAPLRLPEAPEPSPGLRHHEWRPAGRVRTTAHLLGENREFSDAVTTCFIKKTTDHHCRHSSGLAVSKSHSDFW